MRQNADTLIFRDAELAIKDRTQAGWKAPAFKLHHALLGDGLTHQKNLSLIAKMALPGTSARSSRSPFLLGGSSANVAI
ncbi:hypothetical protein DEA98_18840 [Brucella pseudogrignonensis]|nr:hypothetical protein [Brucella pseudogrignonensis]